jgi:hypothetical protein
MRIAFEIPDELAAALAPPGDDPPRAALEAVGLEAYRERRVTGHQLRMLLGIRSRYELDGFLKEHQVYDYSIEDFEKDITSVREFRQKEKAGHPA